MSRTSFRILNSKNNRLAIRRRSRCSDDVSVRNEVAPVDKDSFLQASYKCPMSVHLWPEPDADLANDVSNASLTTRMAAERIFHEGWARSIL
jgi:hypothetical protein